MVVVLTLLRESPRKCNSPLFRGFIGYRHLLSYNLTRGKSPLMGLVPGLSRTSWRGVGWFPVRHVLVQICSKLPRHQLSPLHHPPWFLQTFVIPLRPNRSLTVLGNPFILKSSTQIRIPSGIRTPIRFCFTLGTQSGSGQGLGFRYLNLTLS